MSSPVYNLWNADELGDGTNEGYTLTAYLEDDGQIDYSNFISVPLSKSDYKAFTDDDDWWCYEGEGVPDYDNLAQLMVQRLIEMKGNN